MAPHCDTLDGPVVKAAIKALSSGSVNLILPWVPRKAEVELRQAFRKTLLVRKQGKQAKELADLWFSETAVRLHREGEGKPFAGLKPAGLDWGPVVPKAEIAIEKGDASKVIALLTKTVKDELEERFRHAMSKKKYDIKDVKAAREYVHAMLAFVLYSHHLYTSIKSAGEHEE